jgi:hypothetical protein
MPGHFTHIYTARRVADLLVSGDFQDWPDGVEIPYDQQLCGSVMREWEKFTAVGAIGPDLFYFSQDYNTEPIGERSDLLMLALATYYYFDAAKEDDWEPLLIILDEVSSTMAALLRLLIKLEKMWQSFVEGWDATIGPLVSAASDVLDDLTGGLISQFKVVVVELEVALKTIGEEELLTFKDIFGGFDTCVNKGWSENAFLWSDMSHYRRTTTMCHNLVKQAERLRTSTDDPKENETRFRQFLAFALGYTTHVGTDTIAHSFVNEQCGGPYRDHPQRHHLIENHIDAWNYKQSAVNGTIPNDPWGSDETYPELSMSALHYAVQLTPKNPWGDQRPASLPEDHKGRKKALDVDGELPDWMCDAIVLAMIETFGDAPHPMIFGGSDFQGQIDQGLLTQVVQKITGHGLDRPFQELLDGIAPKPDFNVPHGFPMPWQIQTMYRIMISFYKFSFEGSWELQKPRKPDFVIVPPWSDVENLFQPPDFSGVDSSNPIVDICEAIVALVEWAVKELGAAAQLAGDLVKMAASPGTYLLRLGLYELAMMVWDVITKTHEVLAHTGFMSPHGQDDYDNGELRLPNEIDLPLITLGGTADAAFQQALADAFDPMGNLDKDPSVFEGHSVTDARYPYYSVLKYTLNLGQGGQPSGFSHEGWEFRRPWAYPYNSILHADGADMVYPTPTERYDASKPPVIEEPDGGFPGLIPGPYPAGTTPDRVFFRLWGAPDPAVRSDYESSLNPARTDELNAEHLQTGRLPGSPLGDPVPFSAYLIGQLANSSGYVAQFNLDSDRAFAYLTWDWVRGDGNGTTETKLPYKLPNVPPQNADGWTTGADLLQLEYVDEPLAPEPPQIRKQQPKPPPAKSGRKRAPK